MTWCNSRKKIGFVDISRPLDDIDEGEESNSEYEMESPIPTPIEDDEGIVEIDEGMRERRQRFQSTTSTLEEPDTEMIPGQEGHPENKKTFWTMCQYLLEEFQVLQRQNHGHLYPQKE